MSTNNDTAPSEKELPFGLAVIACFVCCYLILNPSGPPKTEEQEYRELREHDAAKKQARAIYEWKKENLGR